MTCNESDDKIDLEREIEQLKKRLEALSKQEYHILMERKFINHRLADLQYELSH